MRTWWQWLLLTAVALLIPASFMWSDKLWVQLAALAIVLAVMGAVYYRDSRRA